MVRPPLSEDLRQILETEAAQGPLTLNYLIERTDKRGLYLVLILLCLPFITPVAVPGLSNLLGLVLMFLSLRLALRYPPCLPRFIGARPLPQAKMQKVIRVSIKLLRFLEKAVKPRRTEWLTWESARLGNALLLVLLAFLLALPIPPVIPLTNLLPAYSFIFLAAAMMEEDGLMIWAGYFLALLTLGYFASVAGITIRLFIRYGSG